MASRETVALIFRTDTALAEQVREQTRRHDRSASGELRTPIRHALEYPARTKAPTEGDAA